MKISMTILMAMFISLQAMAYKEGVYSCKNGDARLPDNTYKFETVRIGSASLPYLEINRHYRASSDENAVAQEVVIRGLAAVTENGEGISTYSLNNIRLEFKGEDFLNCKK